MAQIAQFNGAVTHAQPGERSQWGALVRQVIGQSRIAMALAGWPPVPYMPSGRGPGHTSPSLAWGSGATNLTRTDHRAEAANLR